MGLEDSIDVNQGEEDSSATFIFDDSVDGNGSERIQTAGEPMEMANKESTPNFEQEDSAMPTFSPVSDTAELPPKKVNFSLSFTVPTTVF